LADDTAVHLGSLTDIDLGIRVVKASKYLGVITGNDPALKTIMESVTVAKGALMGVGYNQNPVALGSLKEWHSTPPVGAKHGTTISWQQHQ
jgi:hypothetical protein